MIIFMGFMFDSKPILEQSAQLLGKEKKLRMSLSYVESRRISNGAASQEKVSSTLSMLAKQHVLKIEFMTKMTNKSVKKALQMQIKTFGQAKNILAFITALHKQPYYFAIEDFDLRIINRSQYQLTADIVCLQSM